MSMLLSLGPNVSRPLLTAAVYNSEAETLSQRPGFQAALEGLRAKQTIREESDSMLATYGFLLGKVNRLKNPHDQQAQLRHTVSTLQWLSKSSRAHELSGSRLHVEIDAEPSIDQRFRLRLDARWPTVTDKAIAEAATSAMRGTVKLVGLVPMQTPAKMIEGYQAHIHRGTYGISLQTDPTTPYYPGDDSLEYQPTDSTFCVEPRHLTSHAEQLVYLIGGVAAALAADYANQVAA